jgi:hypothetical protein
MVRGTNSTMKRLPVLALTYEDWSIWWRVMYTWPGGAIGRPAGGYYKADEEDYGDPGGPAYRECITDGPCDRRCEP